MTPDSSKNPGEHPDRHKHDCRIMPAYDVVPEEEALQEIREVPGIQNATGKSIWVAIGRALHGLKADLRHQRSAKIQARAEKASIEKALLEERARVGRRNETIKALRKEKKDSINERVESMSRREFLKGAAIGSGLTAMGIMLGTRYIFERLPFLLQSGEIERAPIEERSPELFKRMTPYETVLSESLREQDPKTGIWRDRLLQPFRVSEYMLGDEFAYTGIDEALTKSKTENVHTFAIMGDMSRRYGRNGNHKDAYKTVTLSDAINNLLDYSRLSDENIAQWIAETYYFSFGIKLNPRLITITRNESDKKVQNVQYLLEPGAQSEVKLMVPKTVEDLTPYEKGGNITQTSKTFPLLGTGNRLLLHSGISPVHDLRVAVSYMERDKTIKMGIPGGECKIRTSDLAWCIDWYKDNAKRVSKKTVEGVLKGKPIRRHSVLAHVNQEDPFARDLAFFATEGAKTDAEKIQRITSFVQSLRYIWENDSDKNRPILLTLFNDGSDCNNLTIAWASMMHVLQLDYAILYTSDGKDEWHVMGGIPEDTAPLEIKKEADYKGTFPVELTEKLRIGDRNIGKGHEFYAQETVRFKKPETEK